MRNPSSLQCDVLVIGGGPAGMAAAVAAAESEGSVILVDDNPALGGQIWRGGSPEADAWLEKIENGSVSVLNGARVVRQAGPRTLVAEGQETTVFLQYRETVIATGARELFLPFPGWTLPNVMGAGGLQALVKSGLPVAGKRIVVAGTGPLLFEVAAYLRKQKAEIVMITEQAGRIPLGCFALSLLRWPLKGKQALTVWKQIEDVPFAVNSWPTEAHGNERLTAVTILRNGKEQLIPCDYLACGFHLIPNIELAVLLGCEISGGVVRVDEFQQTTVPGVYCAGEPTMVGGVELSTVEGEIAGLAASKQRTRARRLFHERRRFQRFANVLDRTFQLRTELRCLPNSETIICRCEDVRFHKLQPFGTWRAAKLFTRCGMGPCQGRVCGPAVRFLLDWEADSVRPPIFPTQYANLAVSREPSAGEQIHGIGGK